jgi:CDP-6-deoxy-D-xylo-4-hexulose-3-dehydrase
MSDVKQMIEELVAAVGTPKYAYNCKEFTPGKDTVFYSGPYWDEKEVIAGVTAFLTGKWLVSGEQVAKFQWAFGHKFNVKHCHMVNSGSSANLTMVAALKKHLGWKDGDQVIVSPVGFPTTIAPLVQNGLVPVFVDIEMKTLNFDLNQVEKWINDKTVAIFVSPVLGNPPDMDRIKKMCEDNNIRLIGDNCDSLGTKWDGKLLTDYYYAWTTSFYPAHHISTGEGGMVCSNDEQLINTARSISWWGRDCRCVGAANLLACGTCGNRFDKWLEGYNGIIDHKYLFTNMGYNLKPLDLQGAIGIEQLKKIDEIDVKRRVNFARIKHLFEKYVPGVRVAENLLLADPSWFGVPLITDTPELKEKLQAFCEANKIQTRNYFAGNILLHPGYKHLDDAAKYPNANKALSNVFFVGCPPHYGEEVFAYYESVMQKWEC